jgi:serine/threonine-protein kinase
MSGNAAREIAVPHFVGRYEVLVPIASGGMATVYLARSRGAGGFEREIALKLTHAHLRESPEFQELLIEEAKLAASIRHHNVVSVLDVGDDPLGLFLVMDYVEGDTLSGLLRRGRTVGQPMPRPLALRALLDALAGLHAAHETRDPDGRDLQVVHRDFSPQNILVGMDGIAKLTDFGIAKAVSRVGNTTTGMLKGKIAYMSPEHARGSPIDRRSDVWAAGVLAWEIVTERPLWPRDTEDVTMLIKLVTTSPPRLRDVDAGVSEALDEAIGKALTMEPGDRWPTAAAFAKALGSAAEAADADELGAYVREVAGPKIAQRRQQVRSMGVLRAQMGEIAEASAMTPSGRYLQPRVSAPVMKMAQGEIDVDVQPTEFVETPFFAGLPAPPLAAPPEPVSSSALRPAPAAVLAPRWVPAVVGGVIALCVVTILVATLGRRSSPSPSEPPPSASSPSPVAQAAEPPVTAPSAELPPPLDAPSASPATPPPMAASTPAPAPPLTARPRSPTTAASATVVTLSPVSPAPQVPAQRPARPPARQGPATSSPLAPSPY